MTEMLLADYFYGDESEQFSYFRIPRLLITSPRFKGLSTDAKLLYGMLLDRMSLSAKNGWYDEQSRVYIYYTADEIRADMGCGNDKALKLLSELDTKKGVGLIERIKQGQGKPTKIYVKRFTTRELPADTAEPSPQCPDTGRGADLDFSDFQTSEKSMSRPRQTRCADLGKADASYPGMYRYELETVNNGPKRVSDTASGTFLGTVLTPVPIPMDNGQRELAPDDLMLDAEAGSWTPQEFEEKYLSPNGENGGR